jgi:tetratricopeptide (TPR) repeat protein
MLAGQLLQLDNAHREAEPLIRLAASNLEGDLRKQALINLGDALYAHGDLAGARDAWRYVGPGGDLGDILLQRQRMLTLVERGPREWANSIPDLSITARRRDRSGAEAGYLLAQIAEALGDTRGAAEYLLDLLTRHHSVVVGSDVPDRLWRIIDRRLGLLQRQGRSLDQVAFYNDFYTTRLRSKVIDTEQIVGVSAAYESLGLYGHALSVQREVFAIHSAQSRQDIGALINLVRLYVKNDRPLEALQTVDYIRGLSDIRSWSGLLGLYEGRSYQELGRLDEAREAYAAGASAPGTMLESTGRLALLEAADDNCTAAIDGLQMLVAALPGQAPEQLMDGRAHIALARCLLFQDRPAEALVVASAAIDRADDSLHERYATYLAALAAQRSGGAEIYQEVLESYEDIWSALGLEAMMDAQFQAEYVERVNQ